MMHQDAIALAFSAIIALLNIIGEKQQRESRKATQETKGQLEAGPPEVGMGKSEEAASS